MRDGELAVDDDEAAARQGRWEHRRGGGFAVVKETATRPANPVAPLEMVTTRHDLQFLLFSFSAGRNGEYMQDYGSLHLARGATLFQGSALQIIAALNVNGLGYTRANATRTRQRMTELLVARSFACARER